MLISRKNAKTATAAAIMLADMFINKEPGYEGYIVANSREQAKIAFKFISGYAKSLDPKHKYVKIYRDYITYSKTNGTIKVLAADSNTLDGYNPVSYVVDEFHAAKDDSLYNVLRSGQAMRKNPLAITITSAGFLLNGYPCYEQVKSYERMLQGEYNDDTIFALLYQLDENDDWKDPSVWRKAIPSLGDIVNIRYMQERVDEASHDPRKEVDVKTKNFNMWCTSSKIWLNNERFNKCCTKLDLNQLTGNYCYCGVDLSATRDLTAIAFLWGPDPYREYYPEKFLITFNIWIPRIALEESDNKALYKFFVDQGYAEVTPGNSVDYTAIAKRVNEVNEDYPISQIAYDSWKATMFVNICQEYGLPLLPYPQGIASFTRPTQAFEILVYNEQILIDSNPAIEWMFNNCELKEDHMQNCKPVKANGQQNNKIDCVISGLQALGTYLIDYNYSAVVSPSSVSYK